VEHRQIDQTRQRHQHYAEEPIGFFAARHVRILGGANVRHKKRSRLKQEQSAACFRGFESFTNRGPASIWLAGGCEQVNWGAITWTP
jgi:hypothetical protein